MAGYIGYMYNPISASLIFTSLTEFRQVLSHIQNNEINFMPKTVPNKSAEPIELIALNDLVDTMWRLGKPVTRRETLCMEQLAATYREHREALLVKTLTPIQKQKCRSIHKSYCSFYEQMGIMLKLTDADRIVQSEKDAAARIEAQMIAQAQRDRLMSPLERIVASYIKIKTPTEEANVLYLNFQEEKKQLTKQVMERNYVPCLKRIDLLSQQVDKHRLLLEQHRKHIVDITKKAESAANTDRVEEMLLTVISTNGQHTVQQTLAEQRVWMLSTLNRRAVERPLGEQYLGVLLQKFIRTMHVAVDQIKCAGVSHFSIFIGDRDSKEFQSIHLSFEALLRNPGEIAESLVLWLLQIGAQRDSAFVTSFTSSAQIEALLEVDDLALVIEQLNKSISITGAGSDVDKQRSADEVFRILKGLFIIYRSVHSATNTLGVSGVLNKNTQLITYAQGEQSTEKSNDVVSSLREHDRYYHDEQDTYVYRADAIANARGIVQFENLLKQLQLHHQRLIDKYSKSESKQYVLATSQRLIDGLVAALDSYKEQGDLSIFKQECNQMIDAAKTDFNTHRDNLFARFLGALVEWMSNLFATSEEMSIASNRAVFFNATGVRETHAAKVLYEFKVGVDHLLAGLDEAQQEERHYFAPCCY